MTPDCRFTKSLIGLSPSPIRLKDDFLTTINPSMSQLLFLMIILQDGFKEVNVPKKGKILF